MPGIRRSTPGRRAFFIEGGSKMRWLSGISIVTVLFVCAIGAFVQARPPARAELKIDAIFSPGGGCEKRIVSEIESAEKSVLVQMYMFTSKPITDALVKSKKRGVDVKVILDQSQEKMAYGRWPVMQKGGVKVFFDRDHEIANSKIILIDDRTIITGSYNFTKAAEEKNAENIVVIENDAELFTKFKANFEQHLGHSHSGRT
jgi:phosphatidylserine/phosphatidylglycerophosphate/cardiolipin synthase-like enzyme